MRPRRPRRILLATLLLLAPGGATAQLISPGHLASAHADLEGMRQCVACHQLRRPGISPALCLDCHAPLARRIEAGRGLHAAPDAEECATCHKEHLGEAADLVRFDTTDFDHDRAGWTLEGAHTTVGCRECHVPDHIVDPVVLADDGRSLDLRRTFLGLDTGCRGCHGADDPHGGQFGDAACTDCHDTRAWTDPPGFDHGRTRYPLTGRHRAVECAGCHPTERRGDRAVVRYRGVAAGTCAACHADPHGGAMDGACSDCHRTVGWRDVRRDRVEERFDHTSTSFDLDGAHAALACAACHDPTVDSRPGLRMTWDRETLASPFPRPDFGSCVACHVDEHDGAFEGRPGGGSCDGCHGQDRWIPARYGLERHDRESAFALEGAHRAVPCAVCHRPDGGGLVLRPEAERCASCHEPDDPHGEQFAGRACDECHSLTSFRIPDFDHDRTGYPLTGAHRDAPCEACHADQVGPDRRPRTRWTPLDTSCRSCHGEPS